METNYLLEISKILIPALISIIVVFLARHFERERDAELKIREKKIQFYEEYVSEYLQNLYFYYQKILKNLIP